MARPAWTGSISFGMVSIPIRLVPAVRRKSVSFNQIDRETMARIRYRKVSEATGEEVPSDQIVKGYDVGGDHYVLITDEDLEPLAPAKSKQIALESFVPCDDIDPMMFDSSYYVVPDKTAKPYALLAAAMAGSGRAGIGRFVMRQKEYLAAIRSDGEHLLLSTLVFPDEMVDVGSIDEFDELDHVDVAEKELKMARSLVDALSDDFQPDQYVDEYRVAVEKLIESKAAGEVFAPAAEAPVTSTVIDLAAALEASLRDAEAAKGRHPAGHTGSSAADDEKPKRSSSGSGAKAARASSSRSAARPATAKKAAAREKEAAEAPARTRPRVRKSA
jgi:DNA end-binding protein Ku